MVVFTIDFIIPEPVEVPLPGDRVLRWESVAGALEYEVYADEARTQLVAVTEANFLVLESLSPEYWIVPVRGDLKAQKAVQVAWNKSKISLTKLTASHTSAFLTTGHRLELKAHYSGNVKFFGATDLNLYLDSGLSMAIYQSGEGLDTLSFSYQVQAGDNAQSLLLAANRELAVLDNEGGVVSLGFKEAAEALNKNLALVVDTEPPSKPASVGFAEAKSRDGSALLAWGLSADRNFASYQLKLCPIDTCSGACIMASQTSESYSNLSGIPDGTYTSCVRALDKVGLSSDWSPSFLPLLVDKTVPVVSAGPDIHANSQKIVTGSVSAGDAVQWTQVSGPGQLTITTENNVQTTIQADSYYNHLSRLGIEHGCGSESWSHNFDDNEKVLSVGFASEA